MPKSLDSVGGDFEVRRREDKRQANRREWPFALSGLQVEERRPKTATGICHPGSEELETNRWFLLLPCGLRKAGGAFSTNPKRDFSAMCRHYMPQTIVRISELGHPMVSTFPSGAPKWGGAMPQWHVPVVRREEVQWPHHSRNELVRERRGCRLL